MGQIIRFIDSYTKENVNYEEVTTWYDGTPMDDSKVDNFIYRKKGGKYYVDCEFLAGKPINVKRFGALGNVNLFRDPHTGDWFQDSSYTIPANIDTAAIQKALDICPAVLFGYSKYLVDGQLNVTKRGQFIEGVSRSTTIQTATNDFNLFHINAHEVNMSKLNLLSFDRNINARNSAIYIANSNHSNFSELLIRHFDIGYNAENANMGIVNNIVNCWIQYNGVANVLLGGVCHATKIRGCEIQAASRYGIVIGKLRANGVIDYEIPHIDSASVSITDNTIENNGLIDVYVNPGAHGTKIDGNYFEVGESSVNMECFIKLGSKYDNDEVTVNTTRNTAGTNIVNNFFEIHSGNLSIFPYIKFGNVYGSTIIGNTFNKPNRKIIGDDAGNCSNINVGVNYSSNYNQVIGDGSKGWEKIFPISKTGYNKTFMIWDEGIQAFREGVLMIPANINSPLQINHVTASFGKPIRLPNTAITNARITASPGAFTIVSNKTKVVEHLNYLEVHLNLTLNVTEAAQVVINLADAMPGGKGLSFQSGTRIGNFNLSNNAGYNVAMISGATHFKLLKNTAESISTGSNIIISGVIAVQIE